MSLARWKGNMDNKSGKNQVKMLILNIYFGSLIKFQFLSILHDKNDITMSRKKSPSTKRTTIDSESLLCEI